MSDLFLDTTGSPATPQALKRTEGAFSPSEVTFAEVSMFGAGTSNPQGVIALCTLNPGTSTGLVECMRIHTNGNVGIGTPSPTQALEVAGTVKATAFQGNGAALTGISDPLKVSKAGDTMTGPLSVTAAGTGLSITNNAAVGGTLTVGSNVGIGTSWPITTALWVNGTITAGTGRELASNVGNVQLTGAAASPVAARLVFGTDDTGWQLRFAKNKGGTITDLMTVRDNGNVGIGTTNAAAGLEINKGATNDLALLLASSGPGWGSGVQLKNTSHDYAGMYGIYAGSGGPGLSGLQFADVNASAIRMTINKDGNVGIGTTTPGAKLDVSGDLLVSGNHNIILRRGLVLLGTTDGTNATPNEVVGAIGFVGFGPQHAQIAFRAGAGFELVDCSRDYPRIGYAQGAYPYAALTALTVHESSDLKRKQDVAPLESALEKVLSLRGVSFRWKDDENEGAPQIGLIAQEVAQVFPELVSNGPDGSKSLQYARLVAPLIEAVKALAAEVDALKRARSS